MPQAFVVRKGSDSFVKPALSDDCRCRIEAAADSWTVNGADGLEGSIDFAVGLTFGPSHVASIC